MVTRYLAITAAAFCSQRIATLQVDFQNVEPAQMARLFTMGQLPLLEFFEVQGNLPKTLFFVFLDNHGQLFQLTLSAESALVPDPEDSRPSPKLRGLWKFEGPAACAAHIFDCDNAVQMSKLNITQWDISVDTMLGLLLWRAPNPELTTISIALPHDGDLLHNLVDEWLLYPFGQMDHVDKLTFWVARGEVANGRVTVSCSNRALMDQLMCIVQTGATCLALLFPNVVDFYWSEYAWKHGACRCPVVERVLINFPNLWHCSAWFATKEYKLKDGKWDVV